MCNRLAAGMMECGETVKRVLRDHDTKGGHRYLDVEQREDGTLVITGQDLGDEVEAFFGEGRFEYEWVWTIPATERAKLARALSVEPDDLLDAIAARGDLESTFLAAHDIAFERWSRAGD